MIPAGPPEAWYIQIKQRKQPYLTYGRQPGLKSVDSSYQVDYGDGKKNKTFCDWHW